MTRSQTAPQNQITSSRFDYLASVPKYRLGEHGTVAREVVTEKFMLGMRIVLLGYEHAFEDLQKARGADASGLVEFADDFRRVAARGAASTILALAENLPKIVDASSVQADVEYLRCLFGVWLAQPRLGMSNAAAKLLKYKQVMARPDRFERPTLRFVVCEAESARNAWSVASSLENLSFLASLLPRISFTFR